jgi:hypothetical protein
MLQIYHGTLDDSRLDDSSMGSIGKDADSSIILLLATLQTAAFTKASDREEVQ